MLVMVEGVGGGRRKRGKERHESFLGSCTKLKKLRLRNHHPALCKDAKTCLTLSHADSQLWI